MTLSEQIEQFIERLEADGVNEITLHTVKTKWLPPLAKLEQELADLEGKYSEYIKSWGMGPAVLESRNAELEQKLSDCAKHTSVLTIERHELEQQVHMAEAKVLSRDAIIEQLSETQLAKDVAELEAENKSLKEYGDEGWAWVDEFCELSGKDVFALKDSLGQVESYVYELKRQIMNLREFLLELEWAPQEIEQIIIGDGDKLLGGSTNE